MVQQIPYSEYARASKEPDERGVVARLMIMESLRVGTMLRRRMEVTVTELVMVEGGHRFGGGGEQMHYINSV